MFAKKKNAKAKLKGGERTKWTKMIKMGKGVYKGRTTERDMLPHPAAHLLAQGPMEASGSIISSKGAPESPSPPCLGSPPSPCKARSGMSSTRAKGTDSCPHLPLPGVYRGGMALHPRKPPFPTLQGQVGQGGAWGTEGRDGGGPRSHSQRGWARRAQLPPGLARLHAPPPPVPYNHHLHSRLHPELPLEATWVPTQGHAPRHVRRHARTHKAGLRLSRWRGVPGGAGHGVWHRESDLR